MRAPGEPLRIVFVGQAVERKGLPVLLRAFEALRRQVPAELSVVGVEPQELAPMLLDPEGVTALGRIGDAEKRAALEAADVLCAPSLGGESFGMVLTEAFAAGTPVVASDIAGYRDVVTHRGDGLLVPRGDATRLAETLRDLALDPAPHARASPRAPPAARSATRGRGWPTEVAADLRGRPRRRRSPRARVARAAVRVGTRAADGSRSRARRMPSLEPPIEGATRPAFKLLRRGLLAGAALAAAGGALLALERIGMRPIGQALLASSPTWVLVALGLMCLSMCMRAISWHAILQGGAARRAAALRRRHAGHLDRGADVGDAAGAPGRALARADRLRGGSAARATGCRSCSARSSPRRCSTCSRC